MTPAIRVEKLGKSYRVNHAEERLPYKTFRDSLARVATAPIRRWKAGGHAGVVEDFWALKDVSFDVQSGDVVGIIGRNGAGKSTLLKIFSQITLPTTGRVQLHGRVGSLLEVGTGFHPELTGRENVFMNGSILGMKRAEIRRKFDEIVTFSGVEKFLDTPVKRYSSGMQVRLAFAVAAHLELEILIVDEVLAVGDLAFQRKCMSRMGEVGKSGCTVLFVSHNMSAIEALCDRALLLESGLVVRDAEVGDVVREYRRSVMAPNLPAVANLFDRQGGSRPHRCIRSVTLLDSNGEPTNFIAVGETFHLRTAIETDTDIDMPTIGVGIDDAIGQRLLTVHTPLSHVAIECLRGKCQVDCRIDSLPLAPGDYWLKIALAVKTQELDSIEQALYFTVVDGDIFGEGRGFRRGMCVAPSEWRLVNDLNPNQDSNTS